MYTYSKHLQLSKKCNRATKRWYKQCYSCHFGGISQYLLKLFRIVITVILFVVVFFYWLPEPLSVHICNVVNNKYFKISTAHFYAFIVFTAKQKYLLLLPFFFPSILQLGQLNIFFFLFLHKTIFLVVLRLVFHF